MMSRNVHSTLLFYIIFYTVYNIIHIYSRMSINWNSNISRYHIHFGLLNFSYQNPLHWDEHSTRNKYPIQFNQIFQYSKLLSTHTKTKPTFVEIFHTQRLCLSSTYSSSSSTLSVPLRCVHLPELRQQHATRRSADSSREREIVCQAGKARVSRFRASVARYIYRAARRGEFAISPRRRPTGGGWWLARGCKRSAEARTTPLSLSLCFSSPQETKGTRREAFSFTVAGKQRSRDTGVVAPACIMQNNTTAYVGRIRECKRNETKNGRPEGGMESV